ncbi:hypothetical protein R3W88_025701 [Solanum pinnatisectum]|uniref:F-box associated beta-propeller type 3 domain-containing protein n=1 Tax=Solanum pinnatisectum TaxID=50273 RepID=A0AAV9M3V2_9SOLN|nr:hypothetical protein R3W88_025701 [Solanum pinnatisectum]
MCFKCISKSFDSLTSEPLFIEAHRKSRVADFLVYYITLNEKFIIYNLGQDDLTCSINGIVCMWNNQGDVAICNPFTREHIFLPNPSMEKIITSSLTCCSLGFDPTIKKFIVLKVCLVIDNSLSYWIFTIGVDKSWRKAYINIPNFFHKRKESVCIDGFSYFINFFGPRNIVAFSVRDEKIIRTIILPDEIIRGNYQN